MLPEFVNDSPLWGSLFAAGVFAVGAILAAGAHFGSRLVLSHRGEPDPLDAHVPLDIFLLSSLKGPVALFVLILGSLLAFMTLVATFESLSGAEDWTRRIWAIAIIASATYLITHSFHFIITWYIKAYSTRTGTSFDDIVLPPIKKILPVVLYSIGGLMILNAVGISVTPMLAGLGIGGLAVALALQTTLGNFFAGAYLMAERELNEGDFIQLEGGPSGYVVTVGWRSTKIKTFFNTLVIIPNSKLADTIITNYYHPAGGMFIMLTGGVSYENNLAHVREVVVDEIQKLVDDSPHSVKDYKPWFGFDKFGDSNVEFWVYYEATDLMSSFYLSSDGIERLHARFLAEGIKRNYPVREVLHLSSNGQTPPNEPQDLVARHPADHG